MYQNKITIKQTSRSEACISINEQSRYPAQGAKGKNMLYLHNQHGYISLNGHTSVPNPCVGWQLS